AGGLQVAGVGLADVADLARPSVKAKAGTRGWPGMVAVGDGLVLYDAGDGGALDRIDDATPKLDPGITLADDPLAADFAGDQLFASVYEDGVTARLKRFTVGHAPLALGESAALDAAVYDLEWRDGRLSPAR